VESVAWITERKDLLFCFFYLLALLAYLRFRETKRGRWYLFSLLFFLASSLSKAMSVTLPLVLMIGDYFLGFRRERARGGGLVIYLPFILISLGIAGLAILGQSRSGLMVPLAAGSVFSRLIQFPEAALFYLRQTLWPFRLVPFYPNELLNSVTGIAVSWTIFLGMGAAAGRFRDNHPGLMPALLIYLVLLLPTGGLVRVGSQILADRFSLLPTIPLLALAAGWLVGAPEYPFGRKCRSAAVGGMVFCLGVLTFHYTGFWDDPISLTERAYRRYPSSPRVRRFMADSYNNAALEKVKKGEMEEAIRCCRAGLKIYPESAPLHHNLGMIYRQTGETDHSREEYDRAIFYKRKIRARRERRLIP
jgi:tetratricopeptide (TPR) repeat protein